MRGTPRYRFCDACGQYISSPCSPTVDPEIGGKGIKMRNELMPRIDAHPG